MDVVRFIEAPFYTAPDHEQVVARRLQGGDASSADFALVGHSSFVSGATVPLGAGSFGKIYIVTEGVLTVVQDDEVRHELQVGDSVFIPSGEARALVNSGPGPAAMIVVTPRVL